MKKIVSYTFIVNLFLTCTIQAQRPTKVPELQYEHPIAFAPKQYVCYQSLDSLTIDGKDEEQSWEYAPLTASFVDIEGELKPKPAYNTQVKMLWDDTYFYFFAKLEEPHIWAKLKLRDAIIYFDDAFEIFIDPDGDSHNYYELQINALNALWDLVLLHPYRVDTKPKVLNNWNIPDVKTAVYIEGSLNDPGDMDVFWSIEVAIPWSALKEFARGRKKPKQGDQWRVNFMRVDWKMNIENGKYVKATDSATDGTFHENNWVWSPTGFVAMHMPEQWGYVQFSTLNGAQKEPFIELKDEQVKWALWQLYFQQIIFYKREKQYSSDLATFTIPVLEDESCDFQPDIYITPNLFEIVAPSCEKKGYWSIRQDGKIEFLKVSDEDKN